MNTIRWDTGNRWRAATFPSGGKDTLRGGTQKTRKEERLSMVPDRGDICSGDLVFVKISSL